MQIPLSVESSLYIAHHLRWTWAREVASMMAGGGTVDELNAWGERIAHIPCEKFCLGTSDGTPAIMAGIIQNGHLGTTWLAGTERVAEVAVEFMRMALRIHRKLEEAGVRRFQAYCLDGPEELFLWMSKLGYRREGAHPGMGVHGETYISFGRF